ncbi:MAG: CAP domain-containing protein [Candidatus Competibacteraceae bacterium]|jgi:uncharacterized protein YkwD|nr:CAP domain-containing protein [Candidatus Competibacteraceae bacterium]
MKLIVYILLVWVVCLPIALNGQEVKSDSQTSLRLLPEVSNKIIERTNQFRGQHDLPALKVAAGLRKTARDFAQFMANNDQYGHRADGNTPAGRAREAGYDYCAVRENIAYFSSTRDPSHAKLIDTFVEGWIDSPGHRENMLAQFITETGVAVATNDGTIFYAVQMFGRPRSALIQIQVVNQSSKSTDLLVEAADNEDEVSLEPRMRLRMKRCFPTTLSLTAADDSVEVNNNAQFIITNDGLKRKSSGQP